MLTIKDSLPDLVIPAYFKVKESVGEWRIIHADYESAVDSLLNGGYNTANVERVQGRGDYPVANVKASDGKEAEVIVRVYRRGGLAGLVLPDIFNDARRPLAELVLTEKGRTEGVPLPEILGLQIKWVLPFFYRAKIVVKRIPDTVTLEETLFSLDKKGLNRKELYRQKANLISSLVKALRQLHNAGINHRDLNIRNILIKRTGLDFAAYIIDLDKSAYESDAKGLALDKRINNLIRLNRSLDKMLFKSGSFLKGIISHTDRLRLFELYSRGEGLTQIQKQVIINKCLQQTGLHKWWWKLIYPAHK
ncbi:MAG TPA: lipopolysaccharide kinase InaA family protein [Planctomycetota bacterium]|nr:lipopolysaccharide kinase InaA family protein [Planctomycetota bacterium]